VSVDAVNRYFAGGIVEELNTVKGEGVVIMGLVASPV